MTILHCQECWHIKNVEIIGRCSGCGTFLAAVICSPCGEYTGDFVCACG